MTPRFEARTLRGRAPIEVKNPKYAPPAPPPPPAPKPRSFQCPACAYRQKKFFAWCPSCGGMVVVVPCSEPAVERLEPANVLFRAPVRNPYGQYGNGEDDEGGGGDGSSSDADDDEEVHRAPRRRAETGSLLQATDLDDVEPSEDIRLPSGWTLWDDLTGGGPVKNTAIGVTAFPGVGKSTLLLEVGYAYRAQGLHVTYLALEEPSKRVSNRSLRLKLSERYPAKGRGKIEIISPMDPAKGETDAERDERLHFGFSAAILLARTKGADVIILDSASKCFDPDVSGKINGPAQLKRAGTLFYQRCQGTGVFSDLGGGALGITVCHATKSGDAGVPQAFTHDLDSTYVGEHVQVQISGEEDGDGGKEVLPAEVRSGKPVPTGIVEWRSHGKDRDASTVGSVVAKMTAEGLVQVDPDDLPVTQRTVKKKRATKAVPEVDEVDEKPPQKANLSKKSRESARGTFLRESLDGFDDAAPSYLKKTARKRR